MHSPVQIAALVLASFAIGYAGARMLTKPDSTIESKPRDVDWKVPPAAPAPASTDEGAPRFDGFFALVKQRRGLPGDHALYAALLRWSPSDFAAAAADEDALLAKFRGTGTADLTEAWFDRWLQIDAAGALHFLSNSTFLEKLTSEEPGEASVTITSGAGVFRALARREAEWLEQYVAALPATRSSSLPIQLLAAELARTDTPRAKALLARFADGPQRAAAMRGYVEGLAEADPRAALAFAVAEKPGPSQERLLTTVFGAAAERGLPMIRELLDELPDSVLRRKMAITALDRIESRTPPSHRPAGVLPLLQDEVERSRTAAGEIAGLSDWSSVIGRISRGAHSADAAEWAVSLAGDPERKLFAAIAARWSDAEPAQLQKWLTDHAGGLDSAAVKQLGAITATLVAKDPVAAQLWAASLPPGALRDQVKFSSALTAAAAGEITSAIAMDEVAAGIEFTGGFAAQFAKALCQRHGAAAAEWAAQLPQGPAREAAINEIALEWGRREPEGAAEWLRQMPAGVERDSALLRYVGVLATAEPQIAAQWVEEVGAPSTRKQAAQNAFAWWGSENPAAARAWLRSLPGLDEHSKQQILRIFGNM